MLLSDELIYLITSYCIVSKLRGRGKPGKSIKHIQTISSDNNIIWIKCFYSFLDLASSLDMIYDFPWCTTIISQMTQNLHFMHQYSQLHFFMINIRLSYVLYSFNLNPNTPSPRETRITAGVTFKRLVLCFVSFM